MPITANESGAAGSSSQNTLEAGVEPVPQNRAGAQGAATIEMARGNDELVPQMGADVSPTGNVKPRRLGDELPLFCERCGYNLNGLPICRCSTCTVLHFRCPECNHHQPINTLRPAVHNVLGRARAVYLSLYILLCLNYFGWTAFAFLMITASYSHISRSILNSGWPAEVEQDAYIASGVWCAIFGFVGRLLLIRWKHGLLVSLGLAGLVMLASGVGTLLAATLWYQSHLGELRSGFGALVALMGLSTAIGGVIAWPIWCAAAFIVLPARARAALLRWQREDASPEPLGRE